MLGLVKPEHFSYGNVESARKAMKALADYCGTTVEDIAKQIMEKAYAKIGLTYKYIAVTEEHDMDGEPVRLHHHLILSGAADVRLAELVR